MSNIDISPEELTRLKALSQKATPGPWAVQKYNGGPYPGPFQIWGQAPPGEALVSISVEGRPNAEYIAAAHPGVVLAMCEEIERLREERATPALRWTKEPPKEAGWYWHHIPPHFGAVIEWIDPEEREPGDGEWVGPIPEPEER